jgi:hypothetical protein
MKFNTCVVLKFVAYTNCAESRTSDTVWRYAWGTCEECPGYLCYSGYIGQYSYLKYFGYLGYHISTISFVAMLPEKFPTPWEL